MLNENRNEKFNFLYIVILLLLFNILCWTKNEGIFYGIFLFFSLIITQNFSNRDKKVIFSGIILILVLRIFIFKYYDNQLNPEYFEMGKTVSFNLTLLLEKFKTITFYNLIYVSQNPIYLITMPTLFCLV